MRESIREVISDPLFLPLWASLSFLSLVVLLRDLRRGNPEIGSLMKIVWALTVLYSGPLGLAIYWATGRKQIATDSIWRRGWRSTAHCYSGCGAGEVTGLVLAVGLLAFGTWPTALVTFALAYTFGFALTMGPLMQEGTPLGQALSDAFWSESASIVVMEVVAIGVDFWLAGDAKIGERLFWSSLVVSLSFGLFAAWPVNVALVRLGVKEGMHDPRDMAEHA